MKESEIPTLSFIIPAYNCASTLNECVTSIIDQDLAIRFEIIIQDDASTDDTPMVLDRLSNAYPYLIRKGSNKKNLGGGATRNVAISRSRGSILYMVDSDNVLSTGCVEPQLSLLRRAQCDAVSVEHVSYFDADKNLPSMVWTMRHHNGVSSIEELFGSLHVPAGHGNYLYTRALYEKIGGYEEESGAMDTWIFGAKHLLRGFDIHIAPETHYYHRLSSNSYWMRQEALGLNDPYVIRFLNENARSIPPHIRKTLTDLESDEPFFSYIDAGIFGMKGLPKNRRVRSIITRLVRLWRSRVLARTRFRARSGELAS